MCTDTQLTNLYHHVTILTNKAHLFPWYSFHIIFQHLVLSIISHRFLQISVIEFRRLLVFTDVSFNLPEPSTGQKSLACTSPLKFVLQHSSLPVLDTSRTAAMLLEHPLLNRASPTGSSYLWQVSKQSVIKPAQQL